MNFKEQLKESKHLMRFAWGLEIIFVALGFSSIFPDNAGNSRQ